MKPRQSRDGRSSEQVKRPEPLTSQSQQMTYYAYENLKICSRCGNYTVLQDTECPQCSKPSLLPIGTYAEKLVRRSNRSQLLIGILITALSVIFSRNTGQLMLCVTSGILASLLLFLLQRKILVQRTYVQLTKHFHKQRQPIIHGLIKNLDAAVEVGRNDHRRSYSMFRRVSSLVRNDHIRMLQIIQLQSFVLRSDMDLELEPLLVRHFDPHLSSYIGEIAKVKRSLITDKAIRYVITYENDILNLKDGVGILTGVTSAMLRKKRYVATYAAFVARYAPKLSKERFMRLHALISAHPEQPWGELNTIVSSLYEEQYSSQHKFQNS
jgi:hypothetical protein